MTEPGESEFDELEADVQDLLDQETPLLEEFTEDDEINLSPGERGDEVDDVDYLEQLEVVAGEDDDYREDDEF